MGALLGWPAVTVLGFLLMTAVVVALGTSSTARYEFERNGARERQRSAAPVTAAHPAGSRIASGPAAQAEPLQRPQAVAVRPAPVPAGGPAWWLVDEWAHVVAGPFADRVDCDWAALAQELPAVSVHGVVDADGELTPRPSPEEREFFTGLGDQLERLPRDWDDVLTDTDPLTTLVVEIAAALYESGLPLHDSDELAGGVCLVPDFDSGGVLVSWRAHDRMTVHDLRGPAAADTVAQSMNVAVADILWNLGFAVETVGATGGSLVTALR